MFTTADALADAECGLFGGTSLIGASWVAVSSWQALVSSMVPLADESADGPSLRRA